MADSRDILVLKILNSLKVAKCLFGVSSQCSKASSWTFFELYGYVLQFKDGSY